MPTLAVVMTTYNGQKYLAEQLESISKQSLLPTEMIIADDKSSDKTICILREFAKKSPFTVHLIENPTRLGYQRNFLHAAGAASADIIAFCDQDDVWEPQKLEMMMRAFQDSAILLVYHNSELIDESGRSIGRTFSRPIARTFDVLELPPWTIIPGHAQAIRRTLLRFRALHPHSIDPYAPRGRMPHDLWYPFWATIFGKVAYLPDMLARYRIHELNTSGWPAPLVWFIVDHIRNAEKYISGNARAARNRCELIQLALEDATFECPAIKRALTYYHNLINESEQRLAIYQENHLLTRTYHLLQLLNKGAYFGKPLGSLWIDALLLDICVGVPSRKIGRLDSNWPFYT